MIPSLSSDGDRYSCKNLLAVRLPWVATATFVAVAIPFIGDLASLSGAIGFTAMTFVTPSFCGKTRLSPEVHQLGGEPAMSSWPSPS